MKKVLTCLVLFAALNCAAKDAPATVMAAFAKMFPGTVVKKWDKEGGSYEANFMKDGKKTSATFTAAGTWEETETAIGVNELPAAINNYVKEKYAGISIKEAAVISRPGVGKMYEVHVKGKDLLFDEQGEILHAP